MNIQYYIYILYNHFFLVFKIHFFQQPPRFTVMISDFSWTRLSPVPATRKHLKPWKHWWNLSKPREFCCFNACLAIKKKQLLNTYDIICLFHGKQKNRRCYKKWLRYLSSVNPNISPAPSTKLVQTMVNSSDVPPKPNYSTQDRHVSSFFPSLSSPIRSRKNKKNRNKYLINPNNALFFREIPEHDHKFALFDPHKMRCVFDLPPTQ